MYEYGKDIIEDTMAVSRSAVSLLVTRKVLYLRQASIHTIVTMTPRCKHSDMTDMTGSCILSVKCIHHTSLTSACGDVKTTSKQVCAVPCPHILHKRRTVRGLPCAQHAPTSNFDLHVETHVAEQHPRQALACANRFVCYGIEGDESA